MSVIRTEHNFVLALPVHREEVHPFMAVPGRPDRIGGFDAKGRNHGVAQRDQRLLPRGWIDECPRRQLAVCTENLNTGVVVMKSAQDGA